MRDLSAQPVDREKVFGTIIQVNTRISMTVPEGTFAGIYPSRVEDISENHLEVAGPSYKGTLVPLAAGMQLVLEVVAENGAYEFKANVIEVQREPIYQVVLDVPPEEPVRHLQRRAFVRLDLHIAVQVQFLNAGGETEKESQKVEIFTRNISGNGVCLRREEPLPRGTQMDMYLPLLPGKPPIYVMGEVVRTALASEESGAKGGYDIGVRFAQIRLTDQDRIVKFIFEKQRKQAKRRPSSRGRSA